METVVEGVGWPWGREGYGAGPRAVNRQWAKEFGLIGDGTGSLCVRDATCTYVSTWGCLGRGCGGVYSRLLLYV
jgi:hypothetical protein